MNMKSKTLEAPKINRSARIGMVATPKQDRGMARSDGAYVTSSGSFSSYIISDLKPCGEVVFIIGNRKIHVERALFDTGSNVTEVLSSVLRENDVPVSDDYAEQRDYDGIYAVERHSACLEINGSIQICNVEVRSCDLEWLRENGIEAIIGMDVIALGELRICKKHNLPVLEFEV